MNRPSNLFKFAGSSGPEVRDYLIHFRAGRSALSGSTVISDPRKRGLIYLTYGPDASLHFCWKNRLTDELEEDIVLLPGDAEFVELPACKTGRAFVLRFVKSPRRLFFWSQEPIVEGKKGEDYSGKVNDLIKNQNPESRRGTSEANQRLASLLTGNNSAKSNALLRLLSELYPKEFGSLKKAQKSTSGKSNMTGSSFEITKESAKESLTKVPVLNRKLQNSKQMKVASNPKLFRPKVLQGPEVPVDLSTSVNMEVLRPLLTNEAFMRKVREKLPKTGSMKTEPEVAKEFTNSVQSPQFQQSLQAFSRAFQTGSLASVIVQFDLGKDCVRAAMTGNLEDFCRSLTEKERGKQTSGPVVAQPEVTKSTTGFSMAYRRMSPSKGSKTCQKLAKTKTIVPKNNSKTEEPTKNGKFLATKVQKKQPPKGQ